jgi:hypothetical protein
MIKIDKDIPLAPKIYSKNQLPFREMKVGDSFVYYHARGPQTSYEAGIELAPKKFSCRKEGKNWRIWRVK